MPHKYLLKEFEEFARSGRPEPLMEHISHRTHNHIPRYNWVGFYLVDPKDPSRLLLGPHCGSFTPNQSISLTQGLCGSAACTGRSVIADDVSRDPRYIQTSDLVKSQISAPVVVGSRTLAVLNVESYFLATFKHIEERQFVEACAQIVVTCFQGTRVVDLVTA